jgi:hypothetical protein
VPTLRLLARRQPPPACLFTDYCEEAAVQGLRMAAAVCPGMRPGPAGAAAGGLLLLNPFRGVVRLARHGSALPAYSSAFGVCFGM